MAERQKDKIKLDKIVMWVLTIGGIIGFIAAFVLAVEKTELLKNPQFVPSCNFNPVLNCGSVMKTHQAGVFGFPNPFLGIAGFAIVTTVGMALQAGAKFKRWFWLGLEAGTIFGLVFIHWLAFQSLYRIGALCPYCMVVWAVTVPIFWYTTLYLLDSGLLQVSKKWRPFMGFLKRHHGEILASWYVIVFCLILDRFWYYWSTLI